MFVSPSEGEIVAMQHVTGLVPSGGMYRPMGAVPV